MQRTLLIWDPPPQLAEHGDQGSTLHLNPTTEEKYTITYEVYELHNLKGSVFLLLTLG